MPDAELLVFRVEPRPPRAGEQYVNLNDCNDHKDTVYYPRYDGEDRFEHDARRAVVPVEDYLSGAVERVITVLLLRGRTVTGSLKSAVRAALLPPPPEPDVPDWVKRCAGSWYAERPTTNTPPDLARHIAKHARAAEGEG